MLIKIYYGGECLVLELIMGNLTHSNLYTQRERFLALLERFTTESSAFLLLIIVISFEKPHFPSNYNTEI